MTEILHIIETPGHDDLHLLDRGGVGPQGPQGPQGPPGVSGLTHNHVQSTPALIWTVNHNLGFLPCVSVRSVGGVEIEPLIVNLSVNTTRIEFLTAFSGTAHFT